MHFDREGMIVATREGVPVGFVHAGFGPNETGSALDTSVGTTHLLMLCGGKENGSLASDLLAASEEYLRSRGSTVLYAGGIRPLNSFYLGLYGGSEIPGVLQSNHLLRDVCRERSYREIGRVNILQCDLVRFRPRVSREMRMIKRSTELRETTDPPADNWWDACVWGTIQRDRFELIDLSQKGVIAAASFWDIQPLSSSWGICTAGLFDLYVEPQLRRQGYASYLLNEAFRQLRRRGVVTIEAHTMSSNELSTAFYRSMGFCEVDHGFVYRKEPAAGNGSAVENTC